MTKVEVPADTSKTPPVPKTYATQGFVSSYLVASMVTLWAVWGEVATLCVMLTDILGKGRFLSVAGGLVIGGGAIVGWAIALYAWLTIEWNIVYYKNPATPATVEDARAMAVRGMSFL